TGSDAGLAWLDLSTGDFLLQTVPPQGLSAALERIQPGEILLSDRTAQNPLHFDLFALHKNRLTVQPHSRFDADNARKRLEAVFGVATLEGFGGFSRAEVTAAGTLVDY